jgi:hypothetical protein
MIEIIINSNLNYAEVKPVYKTALGNGADGISVKEPERRPDSLFSFVTREGKNNDDVTIPNEIRVYNDQDGDIAVFDPMGRDNKVYRRTDGESYENSLRDIIESSDHMEVN